MSEIASAEKGRAAEPRSKEIRLLRILWRCKTDGQKARSRGCPLEPWSMAGILGKNPKVLVRLPVAKTLNLHNMESWPHYQKGTLGSKLRRTPVGP